MGKPNNRSVHETLAAKLSPDRMRVSGKFTAILGYLLGQQWTEPAMTEIVQLGGGGLLASTTVDPFMNEFIGDAADLDRNIAGVSDAAELDESERRLLLALRKTKIRRA